MAALDLSQVVQPHRKLQPYMISDALRLGKYMFFDRPSGVFLFNNSGAIPALYTAVQGQVGSMLISGAQGNNFIELFQTTAQALPPVYNDKGINIGGDEVDNESLELVPGGNNARNPLGYNAGTDPGVFIRATLEIADASVNDQMVIGFRKQEAYQVPTSFLSTGDALYTDFVGIGFSGSAAANDVKVMSDLNNGGSTTVTDTLFDWADGKIHRLEVQIKKRRASFFINGKRLGETVRFDALGAAITAQPTSANPSYTVDTGDFMIPFIFNRRGATAANANYLRRLEIGPLYAIGLQEENRE